MKTIDPRNINGKTLAITVPGSKSFTHRTLIAAALSDGPCTVHNPLDSRDTRLTLTALERMGTRVRREGDRVHIDGRHGALAPAPEPIYLENSGTSMRLLTGVAALGQGAYTLTGTERMGQRPIQDLLDSLNQLGIPARSLNENGCPPVVVTGAPVAGGAVDIRCAVSSQYLSSLLLMAPCTEKGLDIRVTEGPVSKPYIDMTLDILERFGIKAKRDGYTRFSIPGRQAYRSGTYHVEPDASQAGYFWAAAAITGATVRVGQTRTDSRQGDVGLAGVFGAMGCRVTHGPGGIAVTGGPLSAVTVDMANMPDMVPTLAVVAAFAQGTTVIENVAHLKAKECDRLGAVTTELTRMGIEVQKTDTGLAITGGSPRGAVIETYDDHRIAMSFAVAGLVVPGVAIADPGCVAKSFPHFWDVFENGLIG
jgi:3-phosphoshikimate 1-carboxyvinyltransferase